MATVLTDEDKLTLILSKYTKVKFSNSGVYNLEDVACHHCDFYKNISGTCKLAEQFPKVDNRRQLKCYVSDGADYYYKFSYKKILKDL